MYIVGQVPSWSGISKAKQGKARLCVCSRCNCVLAEAGNKRNGEPPVQWDLAPREVHKDDACWVVVVHYTKSPSTVPCLSSLPPFLFPISLYHYLLTYRT